MPSSGSTSSVYSLDESTTSASSVVSFDEGSNVTHWVVAEHMEHDKTWYDKADLQRIQAENMNLCRAYRLGKLTESDDCTFKGLDYWMPQRRLQRQVHRRIVLRRVLGGR